MHNKVHIILAACCAMLLMMTSCKEEKNELTNYDNWEARNTEYFNQKFKQAQDSIAAGSKNWRLIKSVYKDAASSAPTDYIVVHYLKPCQHAEDTQKPLETDSVYVHYRGKLIPRDAYVQDTTKYAVDGVIFDTSYYGDELNMETAIPVKFAVKDLVNGFQTALLNMHIDDRFEVIVPQTLGYGSSTSNSAIPAYSTLRFDIMLTYIGRPGKKMPKVQ